MWKRLFSSGCFQFRYFLYICSIKNASLVHSNGKKETWNMRKFCGYKDWKTGIWRSDQTQTHDNQRGHVRRSDQTHDSQVERRHVSEKHAFNRLIAETKEISQERYSTSLASVLLHDDWEKINLSASLVQAADVIPALLAYFCIKNFWVAFANIVLQSGVEVRCKRCLRNRSEHPASLQFVESWDSFFGRVASLILANSL